MPLNMLQSHKTTTGTGFHIVGRQLVERNGTPFLMRGSQYPHAYMAPYNLAETIIGQVAAAGCNAIRIQIGVGLSAGGYWNPPTDTDIPMLIQSCKNHGLICVLTSADATSHNPNYGMTEDVAMWIRHKQDLRGHEDYVIINLASEYYDTAHVADWQAGTIAGIQAMRAAGFTHTLIADAPDNAASDFEWYSRDHFPAVFAADPLSNTLASVHMYTSFSGLSPIAYEIDGNIANGMPFLVGEFGNDAPDTTVDTISIMDQCQRKHIGYLAFAWTGSANPGSDFDQWDYNTNAFTAQGVQIFNTAVNGIVASSLSATIFQSIAPAATLVDAYTTKDLTKWTWATGADMVSSQLQIVPTNIYPAIWSKQRYDLRGSAIGVEFVQPPNVGTGTISTFLLAYAEHYGAGSVVQIGWYAGNFYCQDNGGAGTGFTTRYTAAFNATTHRFWRMREAAGTVYWDISSNGTSWTNVASHVLPGLAACTVSINSGFFGTEATPGTAILDNLGPKTQLLADSFVTLDLARWTNAGSASVVSGQLNLPCVASYLGGIKSTGTFNFTTARANVKAVQTPNVGTGTTQMIFTVGPTISGTSWQMFWLNNVLFFIENVGGVQTWSGTTVVYNATSHRYWQIREAGGTIYFDASPDAITWTNLAQRPNSNAVALTACKVDLTSGYFGTEPSPGTAIFDDLVITTI